MKRNLTILLIVVLLLQITSHAQVTVPFTPLFSVTQKGDITHASNTVLTCNGGCTAQTQAPPGSGTPYPTGTTVLGNSAWNNNSFVMVNVDQDGTGVVGGITSFNSSNANLTLGTTGGCGVIYAVLTWGGSLVPSPAAPSTTVNYAKRDSVYFRVPGGTNYIGLKADSKIDNTTGNNTYQCYKDVTNLVKAAGGGTYWAANVVAHTGVANMCGGWSLVVLYSDPTLSLKNLVINKGYVNITNGVAPAGPQEFNIGSFFTPPGTAPVNIKLGTFSIEGDMGTLGDSLKFKGAGGSGNFEPVYDALNRQDNYFNSSITLNGTGITRLPAHVNSLGYDADIVTLDNSTKKYMGNSASSATIRLTTAGDQYWVFLLTTAIDVFEPEMRFDKTFVNLNGNNPALPGDLIQFTLKVYNGGSDPADSLTVIDSLYGALAYAPNTLSVLNGPNSGAKTDAAGDDQMEFVAAGNFIKARLGNNANAVRGGTLNNIAPDSVTTIRFNAYVTNDCTIFHCSDSVYNMAYATFYGKTSQQNRSTFSTANGIDPATGCPMTGPTGLRITVPVCALPADTTVTTCTPYNLSNLTSARPGYTAFFNSSWGAVTQATGTGTYYGLKTVYAASSYLKPCYDTIQINFVSTGACSALPIKLSSFNGTVANENITLSWTTQDEINSKEFIVSRSADGVNFTEVATVAAAGFSSTEKAYNLIDRTATGSKYFYYRLTLVDKDGTKRYSNIIRLKLDAGNVEDVNIVDTKPNPAQETAVFSVVTSENSNCVVQILSVNGKQMYTTNISVTKNTVKQVPVNVSQLLSGIYFVKVINTKTNAASVSKLVVR